MIRQSMDLLNKRFGKLTVISCIESRNGNKNYGGKWECKCDCGNIKITNGYRLTTSTEPTRSCGCLKKRKDSIIGKKYGKLLVKECIISYDQDKDSRGTFLCECDCGGIVKVKGKMLGWTIGGTRSCGCLTSICKRKDKDRVYRESYRGHIRHARDKNFTPVPYNLWVEIVVNPCYYCGEIDERVSRGLLQSKFATDSDIQYTKRYINGIDRLDNNRGYELDNCVPCCAQCNKMKLNYPKEYFYKRVETIYNHHINPYLNVSVDSFICN